MTTRLKPIAAAALLIALLGFAFHALSHASPPPSPATATILDHSALILRAINSGLPLPSGTLTLARTLLLTNRQGIAIVGNGTRIVWKGPPDVPMIHLNGIVKISVRDVTIDAGDAPAAILLTSTAEYGSGQILFSGVHTIGTGVAYQMGSGNTGEINCADVAWSGCSFQNHSAVLRVMNIQGVSYHFYGCTATGVSTAFDFVRGGCLTVDGFGMAGKIGATVLHIGPDGGQDNDVFFNLSGVRAEYCTLVSAEANGGYLVNLSGCQQASTYTDGSPYVPAIAASGRGRVFASGCQFYGTVKYSGPTAGVQLKNCLLPGDSVIPAGVTSEGCASIFSLQPIPAK